MLRSGSFPNSPWGVIADDLTGATDAAAAFANHGFNAVVFLDRRRAITAKEQVIVLTSNSRHDSAREARRKVRCACLWLRRRNLPLIYKKLDSTWKGNILPELTALRATAAFASVLVCPANPAQNRIVQEGKLRVRGDAQVNLPASFAAQGECDFASVSLPVSPGKIERALQQGHRFIIADGATERDLRCLVQAALNARPRPLLAGSAAMAAALATGWAQARSRRKVHPGPGPTKTGGTLILAGSDNPVTLRQTKFLVSHGGAREFDFGTEQLAALPAWLAAGRNAVVRLPIHSQGDSTILRRLAAIETIFRERQAGSLFITGGDTALLICRWLRVQAIALHGEILPGLAVGRLRGGWANGLPVATKPGGFGGERALVDAVEFLAAPGNLNAER